MKAKVIAIASAFAVGTAAVLSLASCEIARPFRGPGYSKSEGVTLPDAGPTVWVAVTNAQVDNATRGVFDDFTRQTIESLPSNDGYIGHSVRARVLGNEVWTMTIWRDEASLNDFVGSPTHRAAMRKGLPPVIRAKFLRFEHPTNEVPPTWSDMLKRLEAVEFKEYDRTPDRNAAAPS